MKRKPDVKRKPRLMFQVGIWSRCPLCGVDVPACTQHTCTKAGVTVTTSPGRFDMRMVGGGGGGGKK